MKLAELRHFGASERISKCLLFYQDDHKTVQLQHVSIFMSFSGKILDALLFMKKLPDNLIVSYSINDFCILRLVVRLQHCRA